MWKLRSLATGLFALLVLINPVLAGPAEETVSGILAKWAAGFSKLDADGIASLYSKDTLFFGSTQPLYKGREGVAAYFNALPRFKDPKVEFADLTVVPVGADVINVAGTAIFVVSETAPPLVFRLTQVLVREAGEWQIVSHHVSPKAPPPPK